MQLTRGGQVYYQVPLVGNTLFGARVQMEPGEFAMLFAAGCHLMLLVCCKLPRPCAYPYVRYLLTASGLAAVCHAEHRAEAYPSYGMTPVLTCLPLHAEQVPADCIGAGGGLLCGVSGGGLCVGRRAQGAVRGAGPDGAAGSCTTGLRGGGRGGGGGGARRGTRFWVEGGGMG